MKLFHNEILKPKEIFGKVGNHNKFSHIYLNKFLNKIYRKTFLKLHSLKRCVSFPPLFKEFSLSTRSSPQNNISKILPLINLKVVFRTKSRWALNLPSKTKYQKKCVSCFVTHFGIVAAALLIMVKPNPILRFVSLNVWESVHVQAKASSQSNILLSGIIC